MTLGQCIAETVARMSTEALEHELRCDEQRAATAARTQREIARLRAGYVRREIERRALDRTVVVAATRVETALS